LEEQSTLTPDQYWVNLARDAYTGSTTWFDTNVRSRIINDIRQFQGEHPSGSPYLTDSYRLRSKLFRPKTRAAIRKGEAEAVAAYFASEDVANVRPVDDNDPMEVAAAKFHKALLQYRLSRPAPAGLPWFLTLAGGVQDALAVGVVCSYQDWKINHAKGLDRPDVTLLPPENYRFHPAADWRDVVNTSPYFVILWPMYVKDVRAKMDKPPRPKEEGEGEMPEAREDEAAESPVEAEDEAAKAKVWRYYPDSQIKSAGMPVDTIRQAREKGTDSKESQSISDFDIVWVHQNFMEIDGVDVCFYTLGTEHLLSDPVPVTDKYPQGRPVVVGFSIVEAHKAYKPSVATLTRDTQTEINHVANLRIDATKIGLRPPMLVKRGGQVDLRALTRRGQGTTILVQNTEDVKPMMQDTATVASYPEQDRLNLDFDDIAGAFSGSSVASNRKLNETVGGMNLLSSNANAVSEYQLRTINETWVEQVLRQLIMLEQHYETDPVVLRHAAKQAGIELPEGVGINQIISDEFMRKDVILNVSIGTGSANPQTQLERFSFGLNTAAAVLGPQFPQKINADEIIKELFGKLGYKDGARFFKMNEEGEDPRLAQAMEMVQQLQAALDAKNPPEVIAAQVAKLEAEARNKDTDTVLKEVTAMAKRVEALFAAMNTAQTAVMVPGVMPVADAIAASAGFQDQDAPPVYPAGLEPQAIPQEAMIPQNTSPNFPAQPDAGMMTGFEGGM
jgi:hypothetical protein